MKLIRYPKRQIWEALVRRPLLDLSELNDTVSRIIDTVRSGGDTALRRYTLEFDQVDLVDLQIETAEIESAADSLPEELKAAIQIAKSNIEKFHAAQFENSPVIETTPGLRCWRRSVPIDRVGLYIPGGSAVLFSTLLMLVVPARLAGCREITVCTPPDREGKIDPALLFTASLLGINRIYRIGGAQAIAALAYGTETIARVDKIFGPGNQYVTCAKQLVAARGEVSIDLPAGPTEQLVIADESADPIFVASDLLSQAEHGADSQVVLVSNSEENIRNILSEIEAQLITLPRRQIALAALEHSRAILVENLDEAIAFSDAYAPEHLILSVQDAESWASKVRCAGSVFVGEYAPESLGDYASGTNHTLPTNGMARSTSGVSLDSFMKKITFQSATPQALRQIGPAVVAMAQAEGLEGHARAVETRLTSLVKREEQ